MTFTARYNTAKIALLIAFGIMLSVFIFSLFKNIQYPLLWNDETETAMYAKRILQYGYPKISDGKNMVWLSEIPDKQLGIDKRLDSCSALVWGQYYFASIEEFIAEKFDDPYIKTALLRIPFALAGLLGLCIMALSIIGIIGKSLPQKIFFLIAFFAFSLFSVSLTLHLREVRHPALVVFLSACVLYIYFSYRYYNRLKIAPYFVFTALFLFLLYHVFNIVFFIFCLTIVLCEFITLLKEKNTRRFLLNAAPIFTVFILVAPFFLFCQTFSYGKAYRDFYQTFCELSWNAGILSLLRFFQKYEFLYLALTAKAVFFFIRAYCLKLRINPGPAILQRMKISNFLSLLFIVYAAIISFFPTTFLFERYYIVLQPIMTMILLLDVFGTFDLISVASPISRARLNKGLYSMLLAIILLLNGPNKIEQMKGHIYELSHQYKGPLDFAIPFLRSNYKNTENLVIATNYEELAYAYYLGSKVLIGFVGNNLAEDAAARPDIIIFRKRPTFTDPEIFRRFLLRDKYKRVLFPVLDYMVNNIPDQSNPFIKHLYKTPVCKDEKICLDILIRSDYAP